MRLARLAPPLLVICALVPRPAAGVASPWAVNGPSRVRLVTPWTALAAKPGELRLGLEFLLEPGWHVYWKNSGDAGYPPTITLSGSPAAVHGELLWPAPRRFELAGGLVAFGYEGEIVYPIRAALAPDARLATGGKERLSADIDYLVCQVDCIPFRSKLALDQPLGSPETPDLQTAPPIERAWNQLPLPVETLSGVTARTDFTTMPGGAPSLAVRLEGPAAAKAGADLFLEPQDLFETGKPVVMREGNALLFRVPLTAKQAGKPLPATYPFAWTATGIEQGGREVSLAARADVPLRPEARAETGTSGSAELGALAPPIRPLGLAFLAGLSTLLALGLWGLLRRNASGDSPPADGFPRQALGFLAAAGTLGLLYELARSVRAEGLAGIELSLLAMALAAWLRRNAARGSKLSWALAGALGLFVVAAVWLAARTAL